MKYKYKHKYLSKFDALRSRVFYMAEHLLRHAVDVRTINGVLKEHVHDSEAILEDIACDARDLAELVRMAMSYENFKDIDGGFVLAHDNLAECCEHIYVEMDDASAAKKYAAEAITIIHAIKKMLDELEKYESTYASDSEYKHGRKSYKY